MEQMIRLEPKGSSRLTTVLAQLAQVFNSAYSDLPWPSNFENIVVYTEIVGGYGDVASAGKIIACLRAVDQKVKIKWIIKGRIRDDPWKFIPGAHDRLWIEFTHDPSSKVEFTTVDLIVCGPTNITRKAKQWSMILGIEITCPIIKFLEIAYSYEVISVYAAETRLARWPEVYVYERSTTEGSIFPQHSRKRLTPEELSPERIAHHEKKKKEYIAELYEEWPDLLLKQDGLVMGIKPGTGVLRHENYMESSFSDVITKYLTEDISGFSVNCGYAHRMASKLKFIDCVTFSADAERILIILNQEGELEKYDFSGFVRRICTEARMNKLQAEGYGRLLISGRKHQHTQKFDGSKTLIIVVRKWYPHEDFLVFQGASERILATGDNSPIEAWASLVTTGKLFLYEDVANAGCKSKFLQQQVALATQIYPPYGQLLAMFGGERTKYAECLNKEWSNEHWSEVREILSASDLSSHVRTFCRTILEEYRFETLWLNLVKRQVYLQRYPELHALELQIGGTDFIPDLVAGVENQTLGALVIDPSLTTTLRQALSEKI